MGTYLEYCDCGGSDIWKETDLGKNVALYTFIVYLICCSDTFIPHSPVGGDQLVFMSVCLFVCLSVCPLAYPKKNTFPNFTQFCTRSPVAVARFAFVGNAICYVYL